MIIACIKCKGDFDQGVSQYRRCHSCREYQKKISNEKRQITKKRDLRPERNIFYNLRKQYQNPMEWISV